jgi:phosphatidylglycerol:prolipoprotein diacylglycerol transferase
MFPVLLEIGGIRIYSYGFFIALGYLSTLAYGRWIARRRGLDPAPFMDLAFVAIVSGVIGARVLYVITEPAEFLRNPYSVLDFWNGGLVFYGGFLGATLACIAYGLWKKMPMWLTTDIAVTGVALAHGFGRIGCFAAGCCHGNYCPYPWGVHNETEFVAPQFKGQPLHPVQLYEAFALFVLAGVLARLLYKKKTPDGMVALLYLTGYAAIRFVMEFYRGDEDRGVVLGGALSTSQGIALALFAVGLALAFARFGLRRKVRGNL